MKTDEPFYWETLTELKVGTSAQVQRVQISSKLPQFKPSTSLHQDLVCFQYLVIFKVFNYVLFHY